MFRTPYSAILATALVALAISCGPAKPDPVAEALAKRKAGAYVRVVNLSGTPAQFMIHGQLVGDGVADGETHALKLVPPRSTKVVKDGKESSIEAESGVVHSLVFLPGSQAPVVIKGEERKSDVGASIQVLNVSGSTVKSTVLSESNETKDKSAGTAFKEMSGKVEVKLSSGAGSITHTIECEDKAAYSIVVYTRNGKLMASTLLNSVKMQFEMGGMSPSG